MEPYISPELTELISTERRYGVIVGLDSNDRNQADAVKAELEKCFPGITFAIVSGGSSVAFPLPDDAA